MAQGAVSMATAAAVDIGGTRVRAALVSAEGRILRRLSEPVRAPEDGRALTAQVVGLLRQLGEPGQRPVAVGMSVPAVLDREAGRVQWAPNLPGWNGAPLARQVSDALDLPVVLEYDGHAAALGEQWVGAGRLVLDLAFIIVGTGVGGAFVSGGRLVRGATNLAGAGGWMAVPAPQGWDPHAVAELGYLESLIAGPALARAAARRFGQALEPREIFDRAQAGDAACRQLVDAAIEQLGWALVNVVALLNPRLILLGGSVGLRLAEYGPRLEALIRQFSQPWAARAVQVAAATLGDDAGLLGAARSALMALGPP